MPSIEIMTNTNIIASAPLSSGTSPIPDSIANVVRITNCTIAGSGRRRSGSAGRPKEIEERERKTVV